MSNLTYTLPANKEEWYIKGNAILEDGSEIYFEIPAIFDENEDLLTEASIEKMQNYITYLNVRLNSPYRW